MGTAYASGVVQAPVDQVWALLREFNGLTAFHPAIGSSDIVEGTDGQCGAVRELGLDGGGSVSERLLALDDLTRSTTYTFTDPGPFPVRRYVATIHAAPVTDSGATFVEWSAEFDCDGDAEAELSKTFGGGVFTAGIKALQERFR